MRKTALGVLLLLVTATAVRSGDGEVRLLTDETIPLYLARGRELARNQQWATMIDVLQRIVIGDPEVFTDLKPEVLHAAVYSDDGQIFYPARELCLKELAAMPPDGLRTYRSIHDPAARELFRQAEAEGNLDARVAKYARVYDDYLVSSVGDDALEKAGELYLELGRYYEALALFRRLVDVYPKDTDRDLAMVLAKAAYCAARIGDREHRDLLLERLGSEYPRRRIRIEGKLVATGAMHDHAAMRVRGTLRGTQSADWPMPGGNPARSRVAQDLPEDLPRKPFWSFRLSERDRRLVADSGHWQVVMHDREAATPPTCDPHREFARPFPTVRPIVYDGLVLYKDCLELLGRRVGSGRFFALRGRYVSPQEGSTDRSYLFPVREVRPVITHTGALGKSEDIHRFFDYGGNSIVAVADQIFTVENKRPLAYLSNNAIPRPPRANLLVTYDRFTGKTLWGWQEEMCAQEVYATPSDREGWRKDYQAHKRPFFRGPGVASGTMLYTIAYEAEGMDGVSLWAFDLKQGRIRFRTLIHHPDEVRQRLPVGASLAVAGGIVYVATSSGVLAAVDALPPGRVRWISRYTRTYEQSQAQPNWRGRRRTRSAPRIKINFAYNDPVVSAGKVILAAPDSQDLIAFDAETGHIAWRLSRKLIGKLTSYIVGVSQGVLVMGGNEVCGIDVAKGEVIWGPTPLLSAFAYGRGFVGTKYAYIPTTRPDENRAAVYRYDIKTGAGAPPLRFDVRKLGNLLSIDGRLIVANDDEIMCFTTAQRELDALDQRMQRGGETGDALLERAHIRLKGGGSDEQAREDYARARAVARTRKEPMRDLRLGSLEHLFRVARKNSDLTAIEEARTITKEADAEKDPRSRLTPYEAQAALLEAQILGDLGRAQDAFDALEKFLDNYAGEEVVLDDEEVTDGAAAAKRIRTKLMQSNRVFQEAFVRTVRRRIREALEKGDIKTLEAIPERYDNAPPTEESLFALAGLHESKGETVEAEVVLRDLAERYKDRPASSEAHLRLARILIGKGLLVEARAERNRGVGLMHEQDRARLADLLAEVDRKLPAPGQPSVVPRLALPLKSTRMRMQNVTPVQIHGNVSRIRKDLLLVADARSYYALDRDGNLLWTQPNPAGADVPFGNDQDPDTNIVAAAVASARFAMAVRGDLIIGDVFGLTRIDATNGHVRWQRPAVAADAARDARAALAALRADITVLKKQDSLPRGNRLPRYTIAGGLVVSVDPIRGVETFGLNSGELIWQNPEIRSPTIGAPLVLGQLLAVGWAHPGRVRVFSLNDGNVYLDYKARADTKANRPGVLLAPPILDPVGRLLVVTGKDTSVQPEGRLELVNARTGRPAFPRTFPAQGRYARVLYVDGTLVVYHDGGSGGENLHFIDLKTQRVKSTQAADLLREVEVINDRARLFVFTYTLGLADLGARLFRVDIEGQESLNYERPPGARAYARPLLTRNHIVIAASGAARARLRLYDREASRDSIAPKKLFRVGGGLLSEFEVRSVGEVHYSVPPAVALADRNLVFSTAFLNLRFVGPKPR